MEKIVKVVYMEINDKFESARFFNKSIKIEDIEQMGVLRDIVLKIKLKSGDSIVGLIKNKDQKLTDDFKAFQTDDREELSVS